MDALSSELSDAVAMLQQRANAVTAVYRCKSTQLAQLRAQKSSLIAELNKLQGAVSSTQLLQRSLVWQAQEATRQQATVRNALAPLLTQEMTTKHQVTEREQFRGLVHEKTLAHERLWQQWCAQRQQEGIEQELALQIRVEESKVSEMKKKREAVPPPASLSAIAQTLTARANALNQLLQQEEEKSGKIVTQLAQTCSADSILINCSDISEKIERIKDEIRTLKRDNEKDRTWMGDGVQCEDGNGSDDIDVVGREIQAGSCRLEGEHFTEAMVSDALTSNSEDNLQGFNDEDHLSNAGKEKESIAVAAVRARMNAGLKKREALVKRVEELERKLLDTKRARDSSGI